MKYYIILLSLVLISALLCHITHELLHIVVGKLCGLKLVSVKWFRYHGGTKVTFENEQEITDDSNKYIPKAWICETLAGIVGNTLLAYLFIIIYRCNGSGYIKLFFWVMAMMYLICDPGYAVLSAFSNSGDLYLVNKVLGERAYLTKILSVILLMINISIFIIMIHK